MKETFELSKADFYAIKNDLMKLQAITGRDDIYELASKLIKLLESYEEA